MCDVVLSIPLSQNVFSKCEDKNIRWKTQNVQQQEQMIRETNNNRIEFHETKDEAVFEQKEFLGEKENEEN